MATFFAFLTKVPGNNDAAGPGPHVDKQGIGIPYLYVNILPTVILRQYWKYYSSLGMHPLNRITPHVLPSGATGLRL